MNSREGIPDTLGGPGIGCRMRPTERNVATPVRRARRAAVRARRRALVETMKQTLAAVEEELLS